MRFPHTIELLPKSAVTSNLAAFGYSYPATGTSYRAFVQYRSASLAEINSSANNNISIVTYAEPSCPAVELDRFNYDGKVYEITGVMPQRSPNGVDHLKIMCIELSGK